MAITERDRHDMLLALEESIGKDATMTLAGHLPPVGWADVATRSDLDHVVEVMDHRFQQMDHRFQEVDRRFDQLEERVDLKVGTAMADLRTELGSRFTTQTRVLYLSIISTVATLIGLGILDR